MWTRTVPQCHTNPFAPLDSSGIEENARAVFLRGGPEPNEKETLCCSAAFMKLCEGSLFASQQEGAEDKADSRPVLLP